MRSSNTKEEAFMPSLNVTRMGLVRLTDDPFRDRAASWSWDSRTIYFSSDRSGQYQTWRIRSDGSGLEQVTRFVRQEFFTYPKVSPDNRWLSIAILPPSLATGLVDLNLPIEKQSCCTALMTNRRRRSRFQDLPRTHS